MGGIVGRPGDLPKSPLELDPKKRQLEEISKKEVSIDEGEIKEATNEQFIYYPNIQSCLSVTAVLDDGHSVGTHMVATTQKGQRNAEQCLTDMKKVIGNRKIKSLYIIGSQNEAWANSSRLFPHAEIGSMVEHAPTLAIGYFFEARNSFQIYIDNVNVKIENGEVSVFTRAHHEKVDVSPRSVFEEDFLEYDDYKEDITFRAD